MMCKQRTRLIGFLATRARRGNRVGRQPHFVQQPGGEQQEYR